jgi:membrane protease YdiL (CAAX protease family)
MSLSHPPDAPPSASDLRRFLGAVFVGSIPLWVVASWVDLAAVLPIALPLSALQFVVVFVAAVWVTRRRGGPVRALLGRGWDLWRIPRGGWRVGVWLLMPLAVLSAFALARLLGRPGAVRATPLLRAPAFLLVYLASAYGEQVGWTAVMTDALLRRRSVLATGLLTGGTWALWHVIPFAQTHHAAEWIAWQCAFTVMFRVLMTALYTRLGRSVGATIALHATYNTAFSMLPYFGSSYDPQTMTLVTLVLSAVVLAMGSARSSDHAVLRHPRVDEA